MPRRPRYSTFSEVLVIVCAASCAWISLARAEALPLPGQDHYKRDVLPLLTEYCYDCHGDGMDKGHFAMDKHPSYQAMLADRKLWGNVKEHVSTHVMPPEGKPTPSLDQRETVLNWIEDSVFAVDPNKIDPGHVTLRRLNRTEYNNTIRDIFKTDSRPADRFPPDDTGYGYDNIGDVLSLSPILMEKYIRAAHGIVESAVWSKPEERVFIEKHGGQFVAAEGNSTEHEGIRWFYSNGSADAWFEMPWEAVFRVSLRLSANQCGSEKPKFALLVDNQEIRSGEVSEEFDPGAPNDHWERFSWDQRFAKGKHKVTLRYDNDFANDADPNPKRRDRNLALESLEIDGPLAFRSPRSSAFVSALFDSKPPMPPILEFSGDDFDSGEGKNDVSEGKVVMACNGFIHRMVEVTTDGRYRIRVKTRPEQAGKEYVKLGFKFGSKDLGSREVKGKTKEIQYVTLETDLTKGSHDLSIAFLNDFYENGADRNVDIERVMIEGPLPAQEGFSDAQWRALINRMGLRLFRRPVEEADAVRLVGLVHQIRGQGNSPVEVLGAVTEAMLCSSKFLFRGGCNGIGPADKGAVYIDEFSLASRLSYFLWSSCPDDELLQQAAKGELRKNLAQQVRRMIGDAKGWALTENFAGQWLLLRDVGLAAPDTRRFPEFSSKLAADMKKESQLYFDHILRDNRSILEFLDSDYSFLNDRLARFYGISGVNGSEFKKVSLAGTPRGGILTQGSILTVTSHPNRTSPVKRGKFMLEQILGTPPPPAPQNVPPLKEGRGMRLQGTLRQRMEQHRADKTCASCHAFLDPMGFAFEHYDAIGRWRDTDNGEQIDASSALVTGQKFDGVEQLRKVLVSDKKKEFLRCLTENLLTYALGRGTEYTDKPFRDEIMRRAEKSDYKFQDIVVAVCESIPFQKMKADEVKKVVKE